MALRRFALLGLLLAGAGLVLPARAQTDAPAKQTDAPAKPPAAKPAKQPAKPAAKKAPDAASAAAAEPAKPLTPEEADRLAYRARLSQDLERAQATLRLQQTQLATEQGKLKDLYSQMIEAVSKPGAESADSSAAGPNGKKEPSPAVKASVNYESQTYAVQVARQAVVSSEKEVQRLQGYLARITQ